MRTVINLPEPIKDSIAATERPCYATEQTTHTDSTYKRIFSECYFSRQAILLLTWDHPRS